jgi:hypothetical protein
VTFCFRPTDICFTYYAILKSKKIGPNLTLLAMLLLPIPLLVWPAIVCVVSILVGAGVGFGMPVALTFEEKYNVFFGGMWKTLRTVGKYTRDFIKFNSHSYFTYLRDFRDAECDEGERLEISFFQLLVSLVMGTGGALVDGVLVLLVATIYFVPLVLKVYYSMWSEYLHKLRLCGGGCAEALCWWMSIPFFLAAQAAWPAAAVLVYVVVVLGGFCCGLACGYSSYHEGIGQALRFLAVPPVQLEQSILAFMWETRAGKEDAALLCTCLFGLSKSYEAKHDEFQEKESEVRRVRLQAEREAREQERNRQREEERRRAGAVGANGNAQAQDDVVIAVRPAGAGDARRARANSASEIAVAPPPRRNSRLSVNIEKRESLSSEASRSDSDEIDLAQAAGAANAAAAAPAPAPRGGEAFGGRGGGRGGRGGRGGVAVGRRQPGEGYGVAPPGVDQDAYEADMEAARAASEAEEEWRREQQEQEEAQMAQAMALSADDAQQQQKQQQAERAGDAAAAAAANEPAKPAHFVIQMGGDAAGAGGDNAVAAVAGRVDSAPVAPAPSPVDAASAASFAAEDGEKAAVSAPADDAAAAAAASSAAEEPAAAASSMAAAASSSPPTGAALQQQASEGPSVDL